MKKRIAILIALVMLLVPVLTFAEAATTGEENPAPASEGRPISSAEFGDFVVGATTKLNGDFFTNMWGNNTCDIDVRSLLHGLETVYWDVQYRFQPNPTVVTNLEESLAENGDKTYTLHLAEDLLYNDGSPITARDYLFGLMILAAPQIKAINGMTTNIGFIKGFDAFNAGEVAHFEGLRLIDDYTFSITIMAEYLPFFYEVGMLDATPYPISVIAPGCVVQDEGEGCKIVNADASIEEPIFTAELLQKTILDPDNGYMAHPYLSSGPYKLVSFDWDTRIARFEINEYFKGDWHGDKPSIDNVVFKSVLPDEMIKELEEGTVHLLNKVVAGDDITAGLNLGNDTQSAGYARLGFGFVNFSCEAGPTQFEAVRQAIDYATDVTAFVAEYNQSYGIPVYGYYGIGQWMVQMITQASQMAAEEPADTTVDEGEVTPVVNDESSEWAALTLSGLEQYAFSTDKAKQVLIDDGWTLNEAGGEFVEGTDTVRCKMVDGELMALRLKFGKMQDSTAAEILLKQITEPLLSIGIELDVTEVPFVELLEHYYRQRERTYDMMYLATNFISIFDPYFVFNTRDEYQGHQNTTGYRDAAMEALALNLRRTEPEALLEYVQKWVAFQTYFAQKVPMLPLYGNIYYDFFVPQLQGYHPDGDEMKNWPTALLHAHLAEPVETTEEIEPANTEG